MTEINNKQLCESCFAETDSDICPKCGFNKSEYVSDPLVLPMGIRLNKNIVIGRVMGKGGFGVTYLGYDLRMNKIIAVKEYYPNGIAYRSPAGTEVSPADAESSVTFDKGAEKFYAEAEMVAQFNGNPNIVSVYDYFRENNTVYLVMEYISGITLKSYVKKHGRLTDGQALYVMDKIAAALSITHSAGVLHRDISPDNIMVCMDGKIKLIDFGAARQIMAESSSNLTVVMKPGYTPIEQYTKKGKQGAWTDIYSLGVSVYYALTGVIIDDPYARMDDDSELEENKHGINGDLWEILKKCTMINAPDRYGSAIELRKALKSVSAPIKPEKLSLDEDDLKIGEEETAVAPDIISEKVSEENDFPVTVASDNDGDKTAAIETFEESSAAPSDNVKETPPLVKSPDKKKSNKGIIAGVFAAAVIIIGIFIAGRGAADEDSFATESAATNAAEITESTESSVTTAKKADTAEDTTVTTVPERDEETTVSTVTAAPETTSKTASADEPAVTAKPKNTTAQTTTTKPKTTAPPAVTTKPPAVTTKPPAVTTKPPAVTTKPPAVTTKPPAVTTKPPAVTTKPVTTTAAVTEPEKIEKPLYIPLSTKYPGRWNSDPDNPINKSSLKYFTGDIKVVLDVECVNVDKNDEGTYWHSLTIRDRWYSALNVYAVNQGRSPWDNYDIHEGQTKFTFTVKRADIDKIPEKIEFQVENVIVKGATIYDYDPKEDKINPKAKIIQLDSTYPGTWSWSKAIPKEELESFKGDVRVTLSIETVKEDKEIINIDDKDVTAYWVNMDCNTFTDSFSDIKEVFVKADNCGSSEERFYNLGIYNVPDKFTFVISSSEISKLYDGGLCFGCRNVIIKSAALEKA